MFAKDTADEIVELEQDGIVRIYTVNRLQTTPVVLLRRLLNPSFSSEPLRVPTNL